MPDLEHCPFCGYKAEIKHTQQGFGTAYSHVQCTNNVCAVKSKAFAVSFDKSSDEEAAKVWNKRFKGLSSVKN